MNRSMQRSLDAVRAERQRQDDKWGSDRRQQHAHWLAILTEETGEVAERVCHLEVGPQEGDPRARAADAEALRDELVQVAAVAVAWLEQIDGEGRT